MTWKVLCLAVSSQRHPGKMAIDTLLVVWCYIRCCPCFFTNCHTQIGVNLVSELAILSESEANALVMNSIIVAATVTFALPTSMSQKVLRQCCRLYGL